MQGYVREKEDETMSEMKTIFILAQEILKTGYFSPRATEDDVWEALDVLSFRTQGIAFFPPGCNPKDIQWPRVPAKKAHGLCPEGIYILCGKATPRTAAIAMLRKARAYMEAYPPKRGTKIG
jgi:hypothetical protein